MKLAGLDGVAEMSVKKGEGVLPENQPIVPTKVVALSGKHTVREGEF